MRALYRWGLFFLYLVAIVIGGLLATATPDLDDTRSVVLAWPSALALALCGLGSLFYGRLRPRFSPSAACLYGALVLAAYLAVRAWLSPVPHGARIDLMLLAMGLSTYLLTSLFFVHPAQRMALAGVLAALVVGDLAMGFAQHVGDGQLHLVPGLYRPDTGERIGGLFINPNHLAAFLNGSGLLLLGVALLGRGGAVRRILLLFLVCGAAVGVAASMSRAGIVAWGGGGLLILGLAAWLLRQTHRYLFWRIAVGGGILVLLLGGLVGVVGLRALDERGGVGGGDVRRAIWQPAIEQVERSPWVGTGARTFQEFERVYRTPEMGSWLGESRFAHNDWLQLAGEYGLVGLALGLCVLGLHLWRGLAYVRWFAREKFPSSGTLSSGSLGLVVGAIGALLAICGQALFDFHLHVPAVVILVAALMGIMANPGFERLGEEGGQPSRGEGEGGRLGWLVGRLALVLASGWLGYGAAVHLPGQFAHYRASLLEASKPLESLAWLARAVGHEPGNALYRRSRGELRLAMVAELHSGFAGLAREDLELAAAAWPNDLRSHERLALSYELEGRFEEAERHYDRAVELAPGYGIVRLLRAEFYGGQGRWPEALEEAWAARSESLAFRPGYGAWLEVYEWLEEGAREAGLEVPERPF